MNRNLFSESKQSVCSKEAKSGDVGEHCRQKICVAKVQLEMKLTRNKLDGWGNFFFNMHSWVPSLLECARIWTQ